MAKPKTSGIGAGGASGGTASTVSDANGSVVDVPNVDKPKYSIDSQFDAKPFTKGEWQQHYDAQNPTDKQKKYTAMYINPNATSTGYSPSQNMNYKIDKGLNLSPQQKAMQKTMEELASPLGHELHTPSWCPRRCARTARHKGLDGHERGRAEAGSGRGGVGQEVVHLYVIRL